MKIFIIGSRKFFDDMERLLDEFRKNLIPALAAGKEREGDEGGITEAFRRIDESDLVYVFCPGGYIGNAGMLEIGYAFAKGKEIFASHVPGEEAIFPLIQGIESPEGFVEKAKQRFWNGIYDKYEIPRGLRRHMKLVAKVGRRVAECLRGKVDIDPDLVERLCMLHDVGNVVRFSLTPESLSRHGYSIDERDRLARLKRRFVERYGPDEFSVTVKIARELGFDREADILEKLFGLANHEDVLKMDWNTKVMAYADFRVSPDGIVSLRERIRDLCTRRGFDEKEFEYAYKLEEQIKGKCGEVPV